MKPTKAIVELASGHNVTVTPLTLFAQAAIRAYTVDAVPDVDPEPYRETIPNALVAGAKTPATDNPRYVELVKAVERRRAHALVGYTLDMAVSHENKAALLSEYKDSIETMRGLLVKQLVADALVSDWVVLIYAILASGEEVNRLYELASGNTALTDGEVQAGIAYFRQVEVRQPNLS